ncbi:cell division protein ZipA C-terminal FtsZ-binding domain-containing protein [Orrella daihaiensis]|uniref:Cell division protein ZipA n=1 Tax=Orrella daihaiensis TaxID=2782176 RepID=A0ABY4AHR4_9BURK|nr:cell division protein ZipA C-terminal FtsZ-binding domain-containing protein [Orrella daihaiensis]UOD49827.1 hypothetical protein DHf2319_10275 [Orrella daihaiensis]
MSELQISLIALGGIVILAIVGFNWWQDRRARQKMQDSLPAVDEDPLLRAIDDDEGPERREPGLGSLGLTAQSADDDGDAVGQTAPLAEPDAMIEAVIELHMTQPVSGREIAVHLRDGFDFGRRPVRVVLQAEDGSLSAQLAAERLYTAVQLAVLLANRAGPITAIEWSQLWGKAQDLAEKLEASVDGPEQNDVLAQANELDSTCATLDAQVTLTLVLNDRRTTTDLVSSATAMGFVNHESHLSWIGDHGLECFTLSRADGQPLNAGMSHVTQLTLLLDVPRSPSNPVNFGRMMEVGQELARRVGGEIVDDQGNPLAPGADVTIDQQLQALCSQLEAAGLTPGSDRARRVFSG